MTGWLGGGLLVLALAAGQTEADCRRLEQARHELARLQLAEIEGAEDIHRAAMWEAFGRCPPGGPGEACREQERGRFGAQWDRQRRQIEAKYRRLASELEVRCRGVIGLARPAAEVARYRVPDGGGG